MKLSIASSDRDHAILVCDEDHNDIAEFFHNEHATVGQSYETALMLAHKLVEPSTGQQDERADWQSAKVSIDVSTCDDDAGHRVFGRVVDWQPEDYKGDKPHGLRLLCEYESDNFGMRALLSRSPAPGTNALPLDAKTRRDLNGILRAVINRHATSSDCAVDIMDDGVDAIFKLGRPQAPGNGAAMREALEPFAKIAPFIEFTDFRDGKIVHRQYDRDGNRHEISKDDFRQAAKTYAAFSESKR